MITIEDLSEILNREITDRFVEELYENWSKNDQPIDPENPEMEVVLESIIELLYEILPIQDDYV